MAGCCAPLAEHPNADVVQERKTAARVVDGSKRWLGGAPVTGPRYAELLQLPDRSLVMWLMWNVLREWRQMAAEMGDGRQQHLSAEASREGDAERGSRPAQHGVTGAGLDGAERPSSTQQSQRQQQQQQQQQQ